MAKIRIEFWGGESREVTGRGCNYMIGHYVDQDGEKQELYAEALAPEDLDESEVDNFGYKDLKNEIISQAKNVGIPESDLHFVN